MNELSSPDRAAPIIRVLLERGALGTLAALAFGALPLVAQTPQVLPATGEEAAEPLVQLFSLVRLSGVLTSVVVIVAAYWILRITDRAVESLGETFTDRRLLLQKVATFFRFGVYIGSFMVVFFLSFEVDQRLLTLLGGTAAVALGFALKDLVASVVAGVMIMFDRPFQVGDRVQFGGEYGDITSIGLRSVRLNTLDDNVVTIPNNKFLSDISASGNYGALHMMVVVPFHVGIDQDVILARNLIREAAATSRFTYLGEPVWVVASQVIENGYVSVRLDLKVYVLDTKFEKDLVTDVTLRVLDAFRTHGIEPPAVLHRRMAEDFHLEAALA